VDVCAVAKPTTDKSAAATGRTVENMMFRFALCLCLLCLFDPSRIIKEKLVFFQLVKMRECLLVINECGVDENKMN